MPVMGMSPSPGLKQRGSGAGDSMAASSSGSGSRSKPAPGMSAGAIGKEMSFAQWMAQMEAEEQAAAAHESAIAEETSEQIRSHEVRQAEMK